MSIHWEHKTNVALPFNNGYLVAPVIWCVYAAHTPVYVARQTQLESFLPLKWRYMVNGVISSCDLTPFSCDQGQQLPRIVHWIRWNGWQSCVSKWRLFSLQDQLWELTSLHRWQSRCHDIWFLLTAHQPLWKTELLAISHWLQTAADDVISFSSILKWHTHCNEDFILMRIPK